MANANAIFTTMTKLDETASPSALDAQLYGIDVSLLVYNLSLTYDARIEQHDAALELVRELAAAREALRAEP